MTAPRVVVLTGAGISAESGLPTFRAADGGGPALWEEHDVADVATVEGYRRDPALVDEFYRARRRAAAAAQPNAAHRALGRLGDAYGERLLVVTQNVDDLHERGGLADERLLHMHGTLRFARCARCGHRVDGGDYGRACPVCAGGRLRPDVVFFGEVPHGVDTIERAVAGAQLFVAIGTSGQVYPAAGLVDLATACGVDTVELDLGAGSGRFRRVIPGPATRTVPALVAELLGGHPPSVS